MHTFVEVLTRLAIAIDDLVGNKGFQTCPHLGLECLVLVR
jgi:hypothetical protein